MKLDFIIIGAAKSGTTWLTDMLGQHEDIFIPEEKELHYFNAKYVAQRNVDNINRTRKKGRYENFFANAKKGQIKGEATPAYMCDDQAPKNIFDYNPDIKLIAVLRNPIEKVYSSYLYRVQRGVSENNSVLEEIKTFPYLIEDTKYSKHLPKYLDIFPKDNILILFFDDLKKDNKAFLKKIEKFIGVKEFIPENINERSNVTGTPKFFRLNKFFYKLKNFLVKYKLTFFLDFSRKIGLSKLINKLDHTKKKKPLPKITEEERTHIYQLLKDDIEKLEKLLHKDLSHWKVKI